MASRGSLLLTWEVTADQEEPWRRLLQELSGPRRERFAESRRNLGISVEAVWLLSKPSGGGTAVVYLEAEDPARALREVGTSDAASAPWPGGEMRRLFGCDSAQTRRAAPGELLFVWPEASDEEVQEPQEDPADETTTREET